MKTSKIIILFIGIVILSHQKPLVMAAQIDASQNGEVSAAFLEDTPSVRMIALGGSQAAARQSLDSVFSNPASLTDLSTPEVFLSHNESLLDTSRNNLSFGIPFGSQALSFSAHYFDDGTADRTQIDSNGNTILGLGDFDFSTLVFHGAWAKEVFRKTSLGVLAKGWQEKRGDTKENGWASDLGIQVSSLFNAVDLGLTYRNLGPTQDGFSLPASLVAGLAYHLPFSKNKNQRTSLFSEVDLISEQKNGFRSGVEWAQDFFWLRGGYENLSSELDDSISSFSFGGGLRVKGWRMDYAFKPRGELGDEHYFSVALGIGLTPEEKKKLALQLDKSMAKHMDSRANGYLDEAEAAVKDGTLKLAMRKYESALEWNPNLVEAKNGLKLVQEKINQKETQDSFQKGLKLAADNEWLEAAYHWEQTLNLNPHHSQAKKYLKKARWKINGGKHSKKGSTPDIEKAYKKGIHYFIQGDAESALKQWRIVYKADPNRPHLRTYMEKAKRLQTENRLSSVANKSKNLEQEVDQLANRAYTLYKLNRMDESIRLWEKILILDPNNKDAKGSLAQVKKRQALDLEKDLKEDSLRVNELHKEALSIYQKGQYLDAAEIWRKALAIDPHNIRIRKNLERVISEMASREKEGSK